MGRPSHILFFSGGVLLLAFVLAVAASSARDMLFGPRRPALRHR